ncbi:hypothetical protein R1flu_006056 [Riccia fluitans]|uniref:Cytochrome b5 heme-binding domain-containing protein n=1 Tax=Riccia fluitans TaxID=41844 RepID=A0ABD1YUZ5_9MARC
MSQFPGFASAGNTDDGDVGMADADDDSSSVSRTAEHLRSSLRISPPPLSLPNPTANYFAVTAAYFPSQLPSNVPSTADKSGYGSSSATAASSQPVTPSASVLPAVTQSGPTDDSFAAPQPPAEVAKPKVQARNKVPLEKGYSQMVWLRTMQTERDIAGLKGQSRRRLISMDEIKQHKSPEEAWTVLRGRVYNITPYMKFHPGGEDMLMKAAGKDSTALFNKYHAWVNAEFLLEKCMVGLLDVQQ